MLLGLLTKLKVWGWAIGAAALAFIGVLVRLKVVTYQRDKFEYRAKQAKAQLEYRVAVDEAETEIENEFSDRRERAKQDRENGKIPHNLRDSSDW